MALEQSAATLLRQSIQEDTDWCRRYLDQGRRDLDALIAMSAGFQQETRVGDAPLVPIQHLRPGSFEAAYAAGWYASTHRGRQNYVAEQERRIPRAWEAENQEKKLRAEEAALRASKTKLENTIQQQKRDLAKLEESKVSLKDEIQQLETTRTQLQVETDRLKTELDIAEGNAQKAQKALVGSTIKVNALEGQKKGLSSALKWAGLSNVTGKKFMTMVGYTWSFEAPGESAYYNPPKPCTSCAALGHDCDMPEAFRGKDFVTSQSVFMRPCLHCQDVERCSLAGAFTLHDNNTLVKNTVPKLEPNQDRRKGPLFDDGDAVQVIDDEEDDIISIRAVSESSTILGSKERKRPFDNEGSQSGGSIKKAK